jgi:hypothetical protein
MIAHKGYGKAADYWSLGCIFYEMLAGRTPFHSKLGEKDILRKILSERIKMPQGITSHACKVVKGLLNRNPQDRLGASRSSMFHIGGVAGLKQMEFFQGISWSKLERKEMEPPTRFLVDNDTDVKHFHEEFIKMDIPPSVIHMTLDHFQPRRCDSQHFRGFSFIQEEFILPDRNMEELEKYWNDIDIDGESASTIDIISEDPMITNGNNHQKKKRPPRKKNKNKGGAGADGSDNNNNELESKDQLDQNNNTVSGDNSAVDEEAAKADSYIVSNCNSEEAAFESKSTMADVVTELLPVKDPDLSVNASKDPSKANQNLAMDDSQSLHSTATVTGTSLEKLLLTPRSPQEYNNNPASVYVPPSLRLKKEQQSQAALMNSFKPAPMYMNSPRRTTEQYSSSPRVDSSVVSSRQCQTAKAVLPQSTLIKSNDCNIPKPFPGSWAAKASSSTTRIIAAPTSCLVPSLTKNSNQNNSSSSSIKPKNTFVDAQSKVNTGVKRQGILETQTMTKPPIVKEEGDVIVTMDWPTLGGATPTTNNKLPSSTIDATTMKKPQGVWGSNTKPSGVVAPTVRSGSAWNNTNGSKA